MRRLFGINGRRKLAASAMLMATVLAVAGCGGSSAPSSDVKSGAPVDVQNSAWNDVVKKANDEGALTLYTSMGQETSEPHLYDAFKKAYPNIKITLVVLATADLVNKLNQ